MPIPNLLDSCYVLLSHTLFSGSLTMCDLLLAIILLSNIHTNNSECVKTYWYNDMELYEIEGVKCGILVKIMSLTIVVKDEQEDLYYPSASLFPNKDPGNSFKHRNHLHILDDFYQSYDEEQYDMFCYFQLGGSNGSFAFKWCFPSKCRIWAFMFYLSIVWVFIYV